MALRVLQGVPVLGYHRIVDAEVGGRYDVPAAAFSRHLHLIRDHNMAVVSPERIAAGEVLANSVALTYSTGIPLGQVFSANFFWAGLVAVATPAFAYQRNSISSSPSSVAAL